MNPIVKGLYKETIVNEPADCETLYLETSYRWSNQSRRMVSIGVLEKDAVGDKGTISLQLVVFYPDKICDVTTVNLLENEIDLVIKGLQDAKERMAKFNEINA